MYDRDPFPTIHIGVSTLKTGLLSMAYKTLCHLPQGPPHLTLSHSAPHPQLYRAASRALSVPATPSALQHGASHTLSPPRHSPLVCSIYLPGLSPSVTSFRKPSIISVGMSDPCCSL